MDPNFRMHAERTPNPNSVKWVLNATVAGEDAPVDFGAPVESGVSPLGARLFQIDGVQRVFLGPEFITISKANDREWSELATDVAGGIKAWVEAAEPALGDDYEPPEWAEEDEVVHRIKNLLDSEIRPYVEQDGGDIVFAGFSDGVVQVSLRGACEGCPSSTVTLKLAIEARLKEEIKEVQSVVSI
jgi:Fe-S cluster biogenesis protein NfuA